MYVARSLHARDTSMQLLVDRIDAADPTKAMYPGKEHVPFSMHSPLHCVRLAESTIYFVCIDSQ